MACEEERRPYYRSPQPGADDDDPALKTLIVDVSERILAQKETAKGCREYRPNGKGPREREPLHDDPLSREAYGSATGPATFLGVLRYPCTWFLLMLFTTISYSIGSRPL